MSVEGEFLAGANIFLVLTNFWLYTGDNALQMGSLEFYDTLMSYSEDSF